MNESIEELKRRLEIEPDNEDIELRLAALLRRVTGQFLAGVREMATAHGLEGEEGAAFCRSLLLGGIKAIDAESPGGPLPTGPMSGGMMRRLREPRWSREIIDPGQTIDTVFFQRKCPNDRDSNLDHGGVLSIHESLVFDQVFVLFAPEDPIEEIERVMDGAVFVVYVHRDRAYYLCVEDSRMGPRTKIFYLGPVLVGPGESFEFRIRQLDKLTPKVPLHVTVCVNCYVDQPIA